MRDILFVIGGLDVGGCERHLRQLLPALAAAGLRPAVYCLTHRGALADALEADGVPVFAPAWPPPAALPTALRRVLLLPVTLVGLLLLLHRRRPAAVHCFLPAAYLAGAPCALLARIPLRLMSRRSLNDYQTAHPLATRLERLLHPHMTRILGNSAAVLRQLREEGVAEERLELIYNGVDTGRYRPATPTRRHRLREEEGIGRETLVLLVVANLIPYKGHADLIDALAGIAPCLPGEWLLLLAGRDDGIGRSLEKRAAAAGIGGKVRLLGPRDEIRALLQLADIGVLPSHQEGFSNTLLESMACGLPVVATAVGGNPEAIEQGVSGLLVPPRDSVSLGEAILTLARDPALREEMGAAARERAQREFSLEACVENYLSLYDSLLGVGRRVVHNSRGDS